MPQCNTTDGSSLPRPLCITSWKKLNFKHPNCTSNNKNLQSNKTTITYVKLVSIATWNMKHLKF